MFGNTSKPSSRPSTISAAVLAVGLALSLGGVASAHAGILDGIAPVQMGAAADFAVLGSSTVTNTGPTVVSGELGVASGTAVTGFPPGEVRNGSIHNGDAQAMEAQEDLAAAYADAASRTPTDQIPSQLGGATLQPGVYASPWFALDGTLTLNGNPTSVFIFQASSTFVSGSNSKVVLTGGVQASNVFWQVGSSATLATGSSLQGTVLAYSSVAAQTGSSINGRLTASNGAVTMDTSAVTRSR